MSAPDPNPKILFIPFLRPGETPVENTPPGLPDPQKFYKEKSGLGSGRRWAGSVAASGQLGIVPADLWLRGQVTSCLTPFRGRGGAVSGPVRR